MHMRPHAPQYRYSEPKAIPVPIPFGAKRMSDDLVELSKARNERVMQRENKQVAIERAREDAGLALVQLGPKALVRLQGMLDSEDDNVAIRAIEIVMSRLVPKVAAVTSGETEQEKVIAGDKRMLIEDVERLLKEGGKK